VNGWEMDQAHNQFKRSLLYYPTIKIPSGQWLKQALLYWDEIGSIVPRNLNNTWTISPSADLEYLTSEGIFYPYDPRSIEWNWEIYKQFFDELTRIVHSNIFSGLLPPGNQRVYDSQIHWDKVSESILGFLLEEKLVKLTSSQSKNFFMTNSAYFSSIGSKTGKWIYFERNAALLYMSLLAKYLARCDERGNVITTPSTDRPEYQYLTFERESMGDNEVGIDVMINNWLPLPDPHVPITDIVAFKRKRKDELLCLQLLMTDFEQNLRKAESVDEAKQIAYQFDLAKRKGLEDLKASLKEAKIETNWGSLNTLMGVTAPPLVGFLAGKIAEAAQIANPVTVGVIAFGLSASVAIKAYLVARQNVVNEKNRNSPYSYLFHGQQELIISG